MGLRNEREIRFFRRESDGRMGHGEREWGGLMFDTSDPKIEGVLGEIISTPFEERKSLHAAHHYTLGRL